MRTTTAAKAKPTRTVRASAPAKAPAKTPSRPTITTAAKAPAKAPAEAAARITPAAPVASRSDKDDKAKKPKMVRDSFTIPKAEYVALDELKQRAARAGTAVKKSELLRAGIKTLVAMDDQRFAAAIAAVPAIKTGRPAKA